MSQPANTAAASGWIVAPAEEQSGAGHSLTLGRPVRLRQFDARRFAVSGTPTDAVMMALRKILPNTSHAHYSNVLTSQGSG